LIFVGFTLHKFFYSHGKNSGYKKLIYTELYIIYYSWNAEKF